MGKSAVRLHTGRDLARRVITEVIIALAVGAAALYVVAEWPIEVATFIYREM
jgi:hypothetical protein